MEVEGTVEVEGKTAGCHTPFLGQHWRQASRVEPGWSQEAPTPLPTFRVGASEPLLFLQPCLRAHRLLPGEVGVWEVPSPGLGAAPQLPDSDLSNSTSSEGLATLVLCLERPICLGWV